MKSLQRHLLSYLGSIFLFTFLFTIPLYAEPTIVDHTCTDIWKIPDAAINQAKEKLHIAYGHTSHGGQLISGMGESNGEELDAFMTNNGATPDLYLWENGGSEGVLDLRDRPFSGANDLGNPDRYAWETATRNYLGSHPEVNVIIWSWCGQAATTIANIDIYLDLMEGLIADYPNVQFVFMTGHLNGTGATGSLNLANEHIRNHCKVNGRILYDFADIESFDPDGLVHYMPLLADDDCYYDSDENGDLDKNVDKNWALDWQNTHTEDVDWWPSGAAHSQHLNGNLKGYAAWWLWARLAGWALAPSVTTETASAVTATAATLNGSVNPNGDSTTVIFEYGTSTTYGQTAPASPDTLTGTTPQSVSAELSDLSPSITYHYRVNATNSQGTTYGSDVTFRTSTSTSYVSSDGECGDKTPCYDSIQNAVNDAVPGSVILLRGGIYPELITLNESKSVTLQGGWDLDFSTRTENTTLEEAPRADQGSLMLQELNIKP